MALCKFDFILEKNAIFCVLAVFKKGIKKRTKETLRSPLFTGVTARFARAYARRKNVLLYARCEYCVCVCVCVCVLANYLD